MPRKKILLVDDSQTILRVEQMALSKHYDLITANDGTRGSKRPWSSGRISSS